MTLTELQMDHFIPEVTINASEANRGSCDPEPSEETWGDVFTLD